MPITVSMYSSRTSTPASGTPIDPMRGMLFNQLGYTVKGKIRCLKHPGHNKTSKMITTTYSAWNTQLPPTTRVCCTAYILYTLTMLCSVKSLSGARISAGLLRKQRGEVICHLCGECISILPHGVIQVLYCINYM